MKNVKIQFVRNSLIMIIGIGASLQLIGCTSGPSFEPITSEPGESLIYVYRPRKFAGSANSFSIWANQKHFTDMSNGGYYAYTSEPGEQVLEYKTNTNLLNLSLVALLEKKGELLTFHAVADKTYYVKFEIAGNKFSLKHFNVCKAELVEEEVALPEINKCKKIKAGKG